MHHLLVTVGRIAATGMTALLVACASTAPSQQTSTLQVEDTGGSSMVTQTPTPPSDASPSPAIPPRTCDMFAKPGVLKRSAVIRLLDAGLPRWLQGVEGDRALANHRFQGWLVKSLHADDPCYKEVDLRPGDVVQKLNGKSIEKPEQAFDVAESLRTAPALTVDYLRDGKPQRLSIQIASEP
jgi:hypothetical protein